MGPLQYTKKTYSKQNEDKLQDNPKYLIYYTLLWIACIDNHCKIHEYPKQKAKQYLERIYWPQASRRYKNAKFLYRWYALEYQVEEILTVQLGRFLTKECLQG